LHSDGLEGYARTFLLTAFRIAGADGDVPAELIVHHSIKGFGGLGAFFWEPAGYSPFTGYNMADWISDRRATAAMDGFLDV
jgi:hypothetical protein